MSNPFLIEYLDDIRELAFNPIIFPSNDFMEFDNLLNIISGVSLERSSGPTTQPDTIRFQFPTTSPASIRNILPVASEEITSEVVDYKISKLFKATCAMGHPHFSALWNKYDIIGFRYKIDRAINPNLEIFSCFSENSPAVNIFTPIMVAKNILQIDIQFLKITNSTTATAEGIEIILRLLAVINTNIFDLLIVSLIRCQQMHLNDTSIEHHIAEWSDDEKNLMYSLLEAESAYIEQLPIDVKQNISRITPRSYNILSNITELSNIRSKLDFLNELNENGCLAFKITYRNQLFFINIFDFNLYTIDLINTESTTVHDTAESENCKKYDLIINGPFFTTTPGLYPDYTYMATGLHVGWRKYRNSTPEGDIVSELSDPNGNRRVKIDGRPNDNLMGVCKIIIKDNGDTIIKPGYLNNNEISDQDNVCCFDKMALAYSSVENSFPCDPNADNFFGNIEELIGNSFNNIGRPFVGIFEQQGKKYIFTLVRPNNTKESPNARDHWFEIYDILFQLNPLYCAFLDGSSSVYLRYLNRTEDVGGFGRVSLKNRLMPCLIGVIRRDALNI